jgi:elongator complex protein 2
MTKSATISNSTYNNNNLNEDTNEERFDVTNFDPTAMLTNKTDNSVNYNSNLFTKPPDEDFLTNHTLWPEINKLYGHSYEVYTIAASHKGDLFASANVSKNEKYSQLYIWDPNSNTVLQKLEGHDLTIAQIIFSKDDSMIMTVSRGKFI